MPGRSSADKTSPPAEGSSEAVEVAPASSNSAEGLALSIGHAINNPLAALFTNLDIAVGLLQDQSRDHHARTTEALSLLVEVRQAAERVQGVVRGLRATTLPTKAAPASTPAPSFPTVPLADANRRTVRVLVVDDDAMVGSSLKRSLREYDVVLLDNAKGALARLVAGERFNVVFCDLMMPEMTGMDLYDEVLRVAPDQAERMVFLTGGAVTTRARDFVATVRNPVLDKPFDVKALREIVRSRAT